MIGPQVVQVPVGYEIAAIVVLAAVIVWALWDIFTDHD